VEGSLLKTDDTLANQPAAGEGLSPAASLYTAFICMLFGANAVAIKISLVGLGVFTTAGLRFCVASIAVWLWARYTGKPLGISSAKMRQLVPVGLLFFIQLSLFYVGLNKTTASHATLIANTLPFVVMVLAHLFIPGDNITLKKTVGLFLGFAGVLVLFFDHLVMTDEALQGDLTILIAVLVWGCNAVYVKRIIADFHPVQVTLYPMIMAAPVFALCGFFLDDEMVRFIDTGIVCSLFYQTFVTASFGLVAWNSLVRKHGATVLHSFVFIMPIAGVFFGVVLLDEPITLNLIASILLVTTGLLVVNRKGSVRSH
jgi:drug/metabolite transporter (DMT)-like permease